jgi:OmpA-OmpF porin, OOP family
MRWILIISCLVNFASVAQSLSSRNKKAIASYQQAELAFRRVQFIQAIESATTAISFDKKFEEAYFLKGISLKKLERWRESTQTLQTGLLLAASADRKLRYYYDLTDNYLRQGDYEEALANGLLFRKWDGTNPSINLWIRQCEFSLKEIHHPSPIEPQELPALLNQLPMQYFPVLTADEEQIFFTVRGVQGNYDDEDLFYSSKDGQGKWKLPESLVSINSRLREGTASVSADGRTMIVARCGQNGCDLFQSQKRGEDWDELTPLQNINSPFWDAQPSLSADGRLLYFASSREGSLGKADIWFSRKDTKGNWSKPQNAGPTINTAFDEASPFIHANGRDLFFASNGREGFGGFDLYHSTLEKDRYTSTVNLGYPLNNWDDQYAMFIAPSGTDGYYTQFSGKRQSKLYKVKFDTIQTSTQPLLLKGLVTSTTDKPLLATLEVFDLESGEEVFYGKSDSLTGTYLTVLPSVSQYSVRATCADYLFFSGSFDTRKMNNRHLIEYNIKLEPVKKGASLVLNNLFFAFDSYELDSKSRIELEEIARFLTQNSSIAIEISGHTDNHGTDSYNLTLSQKRAESVVMYLIDLGISPKRLKFRGFGASQPRVPNDSEENKAQNRRIELKIG